MTAFRFAFKEYLKAMTIVKNPLLCWDGSKYIIVYYFTKKLCVKLGVEVLHG
jgi:hypothetical protein